MTDLGDLMYTNPELYDKLIAEADEIENEPKDEEDCE